MSIRTDTSLSSSTVTGVSTGRVSQTQRKTRARAKSGTWNSDIARSSVDRRALAEALRIADGNSSRLWFDLSGEVWVLNHTRMTSCVSVACPACRDAA